MDDHHQWQRAYALSIGRTWIERLMIATLMLSTAIVGLILYQNWSNRFQQVFEPVAGLSYERPQALGGTAISDISQPLTFQRLSPNDAYAFNASVPVSTVPLVPSRPFILPAGLPAADAVRALDCLTAAIYYEAASESTLGQQAVAQVILNRVRHSAFPNSVCGVVFSGSNRTTGCQFTFTCDGALARAPSVTGWARARAIARAALSGYVAAQVGQATHYHTLWVAPYWSPSLDKVANIGAHTFYRWKGVSGRPEAFNQPHRGSEPIVSMTVDQRLPTEETDVFEGVGTMPEAGPEPVVLDPAPLALSPVPVAPPPPKVQISPAEPTPVQAAPPPAPVSPIEPERRRRIAAPAW